MERTLEDVVEALQRAKENGRRCRLLLGAECSFTANISLAASILQNITKQAPRAYERARIAAGGGFPSYQDCMAQLTSGERSELLANCLKRAEIPPGYLAV